MQLSFAMKECRERYSDGGYTWAVTSPSMLINERAYLVYEGQWMHVTYTDPKAYYEEKGPFHLTYAETQPDVRTVFEPDDIDEASNSWRVVRVRVLSV